MRMPDHSKIVVAVPTKKRAAFRSWALLVPDGWSLISLGSGKEVGTCDGPSRSGGFETAGLTLRCFIFCRKLELLEGSVEGVKPDGTVEEKCWGVCCSCIFEVTMNDVGSPLQLPQKVMHG